MKDDVRSFCYYSYVGPFGLVGLFSQVKSDEKLRFHANQGLVLFIFELLSLVVYTVVTQLIDWFPLVGWIVQSVLLIGIIMGAVGYSILGMFNVTRDRLDPLPLIGKIRIIK